MSKEQASSIPALAHPRLLIRASAGTGKTFQLSSRYIALLQRAAPEKILASTFTRKAAGEILERILLRLARAGLFPQSLKELGTSISDDDLTHDDCLELLARFTRQLHRVRISTLDSFFAQLAGSHALELGLPSGWRILDPIEVQTLRSEALETLLRDGDQSALVQLMHMLDKGATSRSVAGLMRKTIDDLYAVFVDSPESAWNRFPEHRFLSEDSRNELLSTLEQIPLPQKRMETAREKDLAAIREERWEDFLKKGLLPKVLTSERTYHGVPIPDPVCDGYLQLREHCLAVTSAIWQQQTRAAWQLLHNFHEIFEQLKQSAGGLEFGDVTRRLASSQNMQGRREIAFRMDSMIEHLLLDEFQDTSRAQWDVIRSFAEDACRSPERSFFCVGDVKQAIYGWRGGEASIFDTIEKQLHDLSSQELNVSYRSSPVIMDTVNLAMTRIDQHSNFENHQALLHHWSKTFPRHETARTNLTGYACLRTGPVLPESEEGKPSTQDQNDEFRRFTAEYIADLAKQSPNRTIGVLTRRNDTVAEMIFELGRLGVDASEEGGNPLTDSAAVQLVLSLMKLADHPGDSIAAFHVARSPLGKAFELHDPLNSNEVHRFAWRIRDTLIRDGYGSLVHQISLLMAKFCNRREYRRLVQLAGLADRFDNMFSTLRPGKFVQFAESQRCEEPSTSKVRVMTVHQSKGLEFDIVVLPELDFSLVSPTPRYVTYRSTPGGSPELVANYRNENYFNSLGGDLLAARQQTLDRNLNEALCLLYVALTRAARSLHMLIHPNVRGKLPQTFAGFLRAALAPDQALEPNSILWEHGDPNWDQSSDQEAESSPAEQSAEPEELTAPSQFIFAKSERRRHLKRTTPTQQKTGQYVQLQALPDEQGLHGALRGSLFHRWLQEIIWLDEKPLEDDELCTLACEFELSEQQLADQLQQFHQALASPSVNALLTRSSYQQQIASRIPSAGNLTSLDVFTEFPFVIKLENGELMQGCIDRLVVANVAGSPVAAEVIDFKTDRISMIEEAEALREFYRGQLLAYRTAVAGLFQLEPAQVFLKLAFTTTGTVLDV